MTLVIPEAGAPACAWCGQKYRDGKPVSHFLGEDFLHADCAPHFIHMTRLQEERA